MAWFNKWYAKYPVAVTVGWLAASMGYDLAYVLERFAGLLG